MKEYEVYIFDFDMTLFNSLRGVEMAYAKAFGAVGEPFDPVESRRYIKEPLDATVARFTLNEAERRRFIDSFIAESRATMASVTEPYPETKEVIGALHSRGKALSIVSGKMRERIIAILLKFGMLERFDEIVGYDDVTEQKPSPEGILKVLESYPWIDKKDICYVGDSPGDMRAAKAAGVDGIYVPRGPGEECPYDTMIPNLRALI